MDFYRQLIRLLLPVIIIIIIIIITIIIIIIIIITIIIIIIIIISGRVRYRSRYSECRLRYLLNGPRFESPKTAENYSLLQETSRWPSEPTQPPIELLSGNCPGGREAGVWSSPLNS
jgi:hypothetical protein